MNKDERANRFIGHVETKEKEGKKMCSSVNAEERNGVGGGGPKKGAGRKKIVRKSRLM